MKTQTVVPHRPNPLVQARLDQSRLQGVQDTQAKVGEWLKNHPGVSRTLGRFATKHLRAYDEINRPSAATEQMPKNVRPAVDLDSFQVAYANHKAIAPGDVNIAALPMPQPNSVPVEVAQPMPVAEPARALSRV